MKKSMPTKSQVKKYLSHVFNEKEVKISYFGRLDSYGQKRKDELKTLGYGVPYLIVYTLRGKERQSVLSTLRIGSGFGHDFRADRVDNIVLSYDTWGKLPRHCGVQDFGAFNKVDSSMTSLRSSGEFFLLRPKIEGTEYYRNLDRISSSGKLEDYDVPRAGALAGYLSEIHSKKLKNPELYLRKIRDTVGHGECIFGLADSYPEDVSFLGKGELETIEKKCVEQRWKLRGNTSRLCQVHGDFHPWNILFTEKTSFKLLDRSRGAWGEAADDGCGLSINYIFYSLRKYGRLESEFETLFRAFIETYLQKTKDNSILEAMPLFYTFRALVIASPLWYPRLLDETRRKIFNFAENLLDEGRFDPERVNEYLTEPLRK